MIVTINDFSKINIIIKKTQILFSYIYAFKILFIQFNFLIDIFDSALILTKILIELRKFKTHMRNDFFTFLVF